jgi:hypothetical protein
MSKKKKNYYLVISEVSKYTHGAFDLTPEGLKRAKSYVRKAKKESRENLIIIEK